MVGKTGRKCSSQGINVIAGGSKCMEDLYKASLPQKSSKFDRYIHHIVPAPIRGYKIWDWVYLRALNSKCLPPLERATASSKANSNSVSGYLKRQSNQFGRHIT